MAHPWHDIPNLAGQESALNVVIEIPKGSKVKYEIDKRTGMVRVDRILYSAVHYPANYGFVPRTYCDDGDPLDILVLGNEPVVPLAIMVARPIGVMHMLDEGKEDDKIIGVHVHDPAFEGVKDIDQLAAHTFAEIRRFFEDYKLLERKQVKVDRILGAHSAAAVVVEALEFYRREEDRLRSG
jgi:inorganic pyrophosphatase